MGIVKKKNAQQAFIKKAYNVSVIQVRFFLLEVILVVIVNQNVKLVQIIIIIAFYVHKDILIRLVVNLA